MPDYRDPYHPGNGSEHRTGKPCIEPGCDRPAGTAWSPHWCCECNIARMDRITEQLESLAAPAEAGKEEK